MPAARTCSECGKSLQGYAPQAKTCGPTCRQARARRTRKLSKAEARDAKQHVSAPPDVQQMMEAVRGEYTTDVVKKVVEQELRPIVRDALTEETLHAIQKLLTLTPRAVDALDEDLSSDDSVIRQRAYSLAIKYTIGHPALIKSDDADGSKQIVVNFALDRPAAGDYEAEAIAAEFKTCDLCNEEKPDSEFVGSSDRCQSCVDEFKQRVLDQIA